MSFYKTIVARLSSSGIKTTTEVLEKTPFIGYMVLEAAGLLNLTKNLEIDFKDHCESAFDKSDSKARSTITFNLNVSNNDGPSISKFCEQADSIVHKYPQSVRDPNSRAAYELIMIDDDIDLAIQSSSIYIAAGNISEYTLTELLLLKKKLEFYRSGNVQIETIVEDLDKKIRNFLESKYSNDAIQDTVLYVNKYFAALEIIKTQERQFNQSFAELEQKTEEFLKKGAPYIKENQFEFDQSFGSRPNPDYIPEYTAAAKAAVKLIDSLTNARLSFFNYNKLVTSNDLEAFNNSCRNAIKEARTEFSKFRGLPHAWLNDIEPIFKEIFKALKAIAGCLAFIFYPLIEKYSKRGFHGTFFETKPDAMFDLDNFEAKVCDDTTGVVFQIETVLT